MRLLTDEELVRKCVADSSRAWREFAKRFNNLIYSTILFELSRHRMSQQKATADDIFQQVYIQLSSSTGLSKLKNSRALIKFIKVIAVSRSLDEIRKLRRWDKRFVYLEDVEVDQDHDIPSSDLPDTTDKSIALNFIKDQIADMTQTEQLLSKLVWFHGMKIVNAASACGVSANTAYSHISRSRQRIREKMKDRGIL